jgi:hypothetical protein
MVETVNQDSAPRGEPQATRVKRSRAFDQRLESNRLDFAKGRRGANDKLWPIGVRAQNVAQRWALP